LLVLRLADNPISEPAAAALAASPLGRRLAVLEVKIPPRAPRRRRAGGRTSPSEFDLLSPLPGVVW
jgi:hypothetical protein